MRCLTDRCVVGIAANEAHCRELLNNSLVLATGLVPVLGYENAARIAEHALATGKSVADAAAEPGYEADSIVLARSPVGVPISGQVSIVLADGEAIHDLPEARRTEVGGDARWRAVSAAAAGRQRHGEGAGAGVPVAEHAGHGVHATFEDLAGPGCCCCLRLTARTPSRRHFV